MPETALQLVQRMFETRNENHEVDNGSRRTVEGFFVPDPTGREARLVEMSHLWPPGLCWSHYMHGTKMGEFQFILILMHPDEQEKFRREFPHWDMILSKASFGSPLIWTPLVRVVPLKNAWDHLLGDDQ